MVSRHDAEGAGLSIVRGRSPWPLGHTPGIGKSSQRFTISSVARYDVIVVGAGPAGSTTAYRLACAGARVCLLDRARFPRDKPCGGGLTLRAVRELPFSVEPVVEDRVHTLELGLRYARRWSRRAPEPLVLMTQRRRLDAFLVDRAAAAGAEFSDGVKVTGVDPGGVVTIGGERLEADVVVGADGWHSVVSAAVQPERYNEKPPLLAAYYSYWSGLPMNGRFETYIRPGRGFAAVPTHDDLTLVVGGWPFAQFEANKMDIEGNYLAIFDLVPAFAERIRSAKRASSVPPCPTTSASPSVPAGRWSAMPGTTRT